MTTGSEIVQAERVTEPTPVPKFPGGFMLMSLSRGTFGRVWGGVVYEKVGGTDQDLLEHVAKRASEIPGAFVVRIPADGEKSGAMPECVRCLVRDADDAFKIMHAADMTVTPPHLKASIDAVKAHYEGGGQ